MTRVVVVGAGFAGLTAAYRLGAAGFDTMVFELQERTGGRALTLRSGVSDALVAQTGPARFPADCRRVLSFAREFGLELAPFYPRSGRVVAHLRGRRDPDYRPSRDEFWGYDVNANPWRDGLRRVLGMSAAGTQRFRRGTDILSSALAARVRGPLHLGARVRAITQHKSVVRVVSETTLGEEAVEADFAVCAVPLSMIPSIRFDPPLDEERARLAASTPFFSAVRIFVEMRRPYWRDSGCNGFAVTDTVGEVWDPDFDSVTEPSMLVCYAKGAQADHISALPAADRVAYAVAELDRVFPGATAHFERGVAFSWREQPWIGGAWPNVSGALQSQLSRFRSPIGRVHFAGDYATAPVWQHTVEGAIESAEHVVREIGRAN